MNDKFEQSSVFGEYARYYDLLYRDKDYIAEADYIARLIKRFKPGAKRILELGSGTGIHASLLSEKGFFVHGIERSPEMLARSRSLAEKRNEKQESLSLIFTEGDIRTARLNDFFDSVISLFHVISYQTGNADVSAAFNTAREHLNQDGTFIFDVWYGPAVLAERPTVRIKRMSNERIEITRIAEPVLHANKNLVDVNYQVFVRDLQSGTVKELQETHKMRYFFKPEIELLASQTGFRVLHAEEWLTGNPIGADTWGACFCLKAA